MSVPSLGEWVTFAAGTGAPDGVYTYVLDNSHGEYHIDPAMSRGGRVMGYDVRFAATRHAPVVGDRLQSGLWHHLGRVRTAREGVKKARDFDRVSFPGI